MNLKYLFRSFDIILVLKNQFLNSEKMTHEDVQYMYPSGGSYFYSVYSVDDAKILFRLHYS